MFYNLSTKCIVVNPYIIEHTARCGLGVRKLLAFTSGVTRPDQFVIIAIDFCWSFLVAFVPGTPQVLCWGEAGGPRSRQRLLLDQDQRQRSPGLLWHAKLRWVLDHRSSSDRVQLHQIQHNSTTTQLNTTQQNSTQLNTIQLNSTQFNSTQHNSTQLNTIQLNSTQFYVFPKH